MRYPKPPVLPAAVTVAVVPLMSPAKPARVHPDGDVRVVVGVDLADAELRLEGPQSRQLAGVQDRRAPSRDRTTAWNKASLPDERNPAVMTDSADWVAAV